MKPPLLSAVMITGKTKKHESMARVAVKSFLDQTYRHRELVIVNDGEYELKIGHPAIREIKLENTDKTLGELRNIGLEEARGSWIMQWDDDDYHHPHRMLYQMAHRQEGAAVILQKQMRVDMTKGEALCVECDDGIAGTILHPADTEARYPSLAKAEDTEFIKNFEKQIILNNDSDTWPGPALYLRFYHGHNTWGYENVMSGKGSYTARWAPHKHERAYVTDVLKHYGLGIQFE